MLHTSPLGEVNVRTTAAFDWQSSWFCHGEDKTALSSFHPKLRCPPTPTPISCVSWCWPHPLTCDLRQTNTPRPERPPLSEASETQRGGCAHHSEGPVWLAARLAIGCVVEQSRRQTSDSQESHVRGEAAEHRRWEFAQESSLWSKEKKWEWEDTILTHTYRKGGGGGAVLWRARKTVKVPTPSGIHAMTHNSFMATDTAH